MGKWRSVGMRTGECTERGNAQECGQAQEGAGEHRKLQKSGFHRPGREQAYQHLEWSRWHVWQVVGIDVKSVVGVGCTGLRIGVHKVSLSCPEMT